MCRWMELVEYTNVENILHMHQPKIFAHLLHPLLCECQQNRHHVFDLDKLCIDNWLFIRGLRRTIVYNDSYMCNYHTSCFTKRDQSLLVLDSWATDNKWICSLKSVLNMSENNFLYWIYSKIFQMYLFYCHKLFWKKKNPEMIISGLLLYLSKCASLLASPRSITQQGFLTASPQVWLLFFQVAATNSCRPNTLQQVSSSPPTCQCLPLFLSFSLTSGFPLLLSELPLLVFNTRPLAVYPLWSCLPFLFFLPLHLRPSLSPCPWQPLCHLLSLWLQNLSKSSCWFILVLHLTLFEFPRYLDLQLDED